MAFGFGDILQIASPAGHPIEQVEMRESGAGQGIEIGAMIAATISSHSAFSKIPPTQSRNGAMVDRCRSAVSGRERPARGWPLRARAPGGIDCTMGMRAMSVSVNAVSASGFLAA